ncbi:MAG: MAPEG family protein [Thiotrichaceae bacterium]
MTTELYWLILSILLTAVFWLPYIVNRLAEQGFLTALWDPDGETVTKVPWAERLMRAHVNAVENLVVFAPLVIISHVLGMNTELTSFATMLYFFSRLAHVILFTLRVPVLRIISFFGGFIAQMILVLTLLQWV